MALIKRKLAPCPSVVSQKFAEEVGSLPSVMPAKAGTQKCLIFLDSGSRVLPPARLE